MRRKGSVSIQTTIAIFVAVIVGLGIVRIVDDGKIGVSTKKVQISFWNGFTGPDGRVMLELIRKFNEQNPDIQVTMQRMDWATYYNKLMVAAMDGRGPQAFVIHASTLPRMHRAGFVANLTHLYGGDLKESDFDPYVLDQLRYEGELVGLPLDIHPQGLYGNADMLKAIGLVDEEGNGRLPVNKEEFVRAAREMKEGDTWGFALTLWRNNFQSLMPQFGGRYVDENGDADLDNPNNVRALKFLGMISKEKLVPPPENGLGWVGYRQKKVGMVFDGVYMLGDLLRLQGLNYIGGPIPTIGDHPGTMADSHVLCLRKGASEAERGAVERFYEFLSANSIEWASAGQVPARKSVRETDAFKKMPVQFAFSKQIPTMMYPPRTPILFELTLEIDLAVEKVFRGRATAAEALAVADKNTQTAIDRDRQERGLK